MNGSSTLLWDAIETARGAETLSDLSFVAFEYVQKMGFNHCGFAIKFPKNIGDVDKQYKQFNNFPMPWAQHRYERTYALDSAETDPLVRHLRANLSATAFSKLGTITHTRPDIARQGRKLTQRAGEFGINCGVLVPLTGNHAKWGFMVATTADTTDVRDVLQKLPDFYFFAHHIHCKAQFILNNQLLPIRISAREKEVLNWSVGGKTSWEISHILRISERTVNFHLQNAALKLDTHGRRSTCARALALGIISL